MGHELGSESIYKQYTYARNVIQWNLDIFNKEETPSSGVRLRDEVTEGYNIIPNFFVSAKMDENFDYGNDGIEKTDRQKNKHKQMQFKNRLFDRDTLLLFHYDVNFLFVLSLYARNNVSQKTDWKENIRKRFRTEIQEWLQKDYAFYAMKAHPDVNGEEYIRKNFKQLLGKIYTPFNDTTVYSLALDKNKVHQADNDTLLTELKRFFYLAPCELGMQPEVALEKPIAEGYLPSEETTKTDVLMVMMENFVAKSKNFLPQGKLAVGLKYTKDGIEIAEHIKHVGYILFHTRKDIDQHLYAVKGTCKIVAKEDLNPDIYKNVNTTEMYIEVELDAEHELASSEIHSSNKPYTPATRYDAQYSSMIELSTKSKEITQSTRRKDL